MYLTCIYIRGIVCIYTGALLLHFPLRVVLRGPVPTRSPSLPTRSEQQQTHAHGVTGYATATRHVSRIEPNQIGASVASDKETTHVHRTEHDPRQSIR